MSLWNPDSKWYDRRIEFRLSKTLRRKDKHTLMIIFPYRLRELKGYEDEWLMSNWKFIELPF